MSDENQKKKSPFTLGDVLNAPERQFVEVSLPEIGEGKYIRLRSLTAKEREDYELDLQVKTKKGGYELDPTYIREKLIIRCAVDDAGTPIFGEAELPKLGKMPAKLIVRLFKACQELCGMNDDAEEEADARLKRAQD